ncbi:MAG: DUF456 family protein, partial [Burkholderiales bacterium]|nr:DUF456 family protein [Burkholderiales bacterium]
MEWLWLVVALLVVLGMLGMVLPLLPGVPLLFGGLLLAAWLDDFSRVSALTMGVIGIVAALAWLVDLLASLLTARSAGASKLALWGTLAGALLGLAGGVPGLIIGTVLG